MKILLTFLSAVLSINLVKGILNPVFHRSWDLLNEPICGQQPALPPGNLYAAVDRTRRDVVIGEYPWVVLIIMRHPGTGEENKCMGTIISRRYILTASSCFSFYGNKVHIKPSSVHIRAGEMDTDKDVDCNFHSVCAPKPETYHATNITFHNSNEPAENGRNIALIETSTDIKFNDYVAPICVENGELLYKDYGGERGIRVTGWGANSYSGKYQSKLQHASVRIFTQDVNEFIYRMLPNSFRYQETYVSYFCVEGTRNESTHDSDIGGPLMVKKLIADDDKPRFYLYGLLSFKVSLVLPIHGTPDIYTKARYYMEWVLDNMSHRN